ncbi:MAG: hypothetical protein DI530_05625 [Sphingomonas sp.]|nr:MAG: hypothetical protein DI530_05625 [Sphingomonas sp.]
MAPATRMRAGRSSSPPRDPARTPRRMQLRPRAAGRRRPPMRRRPYRHPPGRFRRSPRRRRRGWMRPGDCSRATC